MVYLKVCLLLLLTYATHRQAYARSARGYAPSISNFKLFDVDVEDSSGSCLAYNQAQSLPRGVKCGRSNWNKSYLEDQFKLDGHGRPRIAGGFLAKPGWFPSFVGLNIITKHFSTSNCGAVIIDSRTALTAGHCIERATSVVANFGLAFPHPHKDAEILHVKRACLAKNFDGNLSRVRDDFAVLYFDADVIFNEGVQPACLPKRAIHFGEKLVGIGVGMTETGMPAKSLRGIKLKVTQCFDEVAPEFSCLIKTSDGGRMCSGDSGSGVYSIRGGKQYVTALVSHGPGGCSPHLAIGKYLNIYEVRERMKLLITKCKDDNNFPPASES